MTNDLSKRDRSKEVAIRALKAAAGVVPFAGSALQELIDDTIVLPSERAKNDLLERLAADLAVVIQRVDRLPDSFPQAALHAVQLAMRSVEEQKREYLMNGLLNFAAGRVSESEVAMLFSYMEALTVRHVVVLADLLERCDPPRVYNDTESLRLWTVWERIRSRFPASNDTKDGRFVFESIVIDLEARGLLRKGFDINSLQPDRPLLPTYLAKLLVDFVARADH